MNPYILILAAGPLRTESNGVNYPSCLTEQDGVSILERIIAAADKIPNKKFVFAFKDAEIKKYRLDNVAKLIAPGSSVVAIPDGTKGSACTALLAACQLEGSRPLLIVSANELVDVSLDDVLKEFEQKKFSAGAIGFKSSHPRYSYVKLDEKNRVVEAAQQNPISHVATTGIFYFSSAAAFVEYSKRMILKNAHTDGKFYVAPVFNEMILDHGEIGVFQIEQSRYRPLKTENHIQNFEQGLPS
jgi:hypothetical protein